MEKRAYLLGVCLFRQIGQEQLFQNRNENLFCALLRQMVIVAIEEEMRPTNTTGRVARSRLRLVGTVA